MILVSHLWWSGELIQALTAASLYSPPKSRKNKETFSLCNCGTKYMWSWNLRILVGARTSSLASSQPVLFRFRTSSQMTSFSSVAGMLQHWAWCCDWANLVAMVDRGPSSAAVQVVKAKWTSVASWIGMSTGSAGVWVERFAWTHVLLLCDNWTTVLTLEELSAGSIVDFGPVLGIFVTTTLI